LPAGAIISLADLAAMPKTVHLKALQSREPQGIDAIVLFGFALKVVCLPVKKDGVMMKKLEGKRG
jgi:hypothetical protein